MKIYLLSFLFLISCKNSKFNIYLKVDNTNGLVVGNKIKISGLSVGEIKSIKLNTQNKVIILAEFDELQYFPIDTKFKIQSLDFLGTKMINVELGKEKKHIKNKDTVLLELFENNEVLEKITTELINNNPLTNYLDSLNIQLKEINKKLEQRNEQNK